MPILNDEQRDIEMYNFLQYLQEEILIKDDRDNKLRIHEEITHSPYFSNNTEVVKTRRYLLLKKLEKIGALNFDIFTYNSMEIIGDQPGKLSTGTGYSINLIEPKFSEVCEEYNKRVKSVENQERKTIIFSKTRGLFMKNNPASIYGIRGKRKKILEIILNKDNREIRLSTIARENNQTEKIIEQEIVQINKQFSEKVMCAHNLEIIVNNTSSGYCINNNQYQIKLED